MQVTAQQGDTVDQLCHRHLGRTDIVEDVLERNPGLAAMGPILPRGTRVDLPDSATITAPLPPTIQLWD